MLIAIESETSKAHKEPLICREAIIMTVKGFVELLAFGAVGYVGYWLMASPMAPWAQAVEAAILK